MFYTGYVWIENNQSETEAREHLKTLGVNTTYFDPTEKEFCVPRISIEAIAQLKQQPFLVYTWGFKPIEQLP